MKNVVTLNFSCLTDIILFVLWLYHLVHICMARVVHLVYVLEAVFLDYMSLDFWSVKNYVDLYQCLLVMEKNINSIPLMGGVKISALV